MKRRGAMDCSIRPVWPGSRICGVAFTVQARAGDNLIVHKAIDMLKPGDVLIIKTEGFTEAGGLWGGMMSASAKMKGCRGLITDGSVRDTMLVKKLEFPIFSRGINVKGTTKALPGYINHPITMCNVTINPGDLVFADNDAVVVVPREEAQEVYDITLKREQKEEVLLKRILEGEGTTFDLSGFNKMYEKLGISEEM
jgi:4-hydroxy-4-methyl-2-oxoglutarate aldolase